MARASLRSPQGYVFESAVPHDLTAQDRVAVAIRPESVRLVPGKAPAAVNTLSGTIRRSIFKGQALSVLMEGDAGTELVVSVPIEDVGTKSPEPGEIWTARWARERTLVVREQ